MHSRLIEMAKDEGGGSGEGRDVSTYDQIPEWYYVKAPELWPPQCNLRCASCTHTFQGPPCFVPGEMRVLPVPDAPELMSNAYKRKQVVCTPPCAARFIEQHMRGEDAFNAREMLVQWYNDVHNLRVVHIPPAPLHTDLQAYGGKMSDVEFWTTIRKLLQEINMSSYCFTFPEIDAELADAPDGWSLAEPFDARDFPALGAGGPQDGPALPNGRAA